MPKVVRRVSSTRWAIRRSTTTSGVSSPSTCRPSSRKSRPRATRTATSTTTCSGRRQTSSCAFCSHCPPSSSRSRPGTTRSPATCRRHSPTRGELWFSTYSPPRSVCWPFCWLFCSDSPCTMWLSRATWILIMCHFTSHISPTRDQFCRLCQTPCDHTIEQFEKRIPKLAYTVPGFRLFYHQLSLNVDIYRSIHECPVFLNPLLKGQS